MTFSLDKLVHERSEFEGRIVVVLAHPDDEVLGCGILLSRHRDALVIHVTDGAPRRRADAARLGFASPDAYAAARRSELEAAMALAGIGPDQLLGLGIFDQAASQDLVAITYRLVPLLRGASVVLTHAYEGGHPDHDATAFAVHAAGRLLGDEAPQVVEMPFYRASPDDWLRQDFAPARGVGQEITLVLSEEERRLKRRMYEAHASQAEVLSGFPIGVELFRRARPYDFGALPNDGLVLYERYGWGLTGEGWLDQVVAAQAELGEAPAA